MEHLLAAYINQEGWVQVHWTFNEEQREQCTTNSNCFNFVFNNVACSLWQQTLGITNEQK